MHTLTGKLDVLMLTVMAQANKAQRSGQLQGRVMSLLCDALFAEASRWRRRAWRQKLSRPTPCWTPFIRMRSFSIDDGKEALRGTGDIARR